MDRHFLADMMEGSPTFRAEPWYNAHGDCIVFLAANEATYADRVDDILTLYRAISDSRIVGFQIKEVMAIIERFGLEGLQVDAIGVGREVLSLRLLLLAAFKEAPPPESQLAEWIRAYNECNAIIPQAIKDRIRIPVG